MLANKMTAGEIMKKKAVIFDMDGLMIDSERVTYDGYVKICSEYNYEMTLDFYKTLLGFRTNVINEKPKNILGMVSEEIIRRVHNIEQVFSEKGIPLKLLLEILQYLKHKITNLLLLLQVTEQELKILKDAGISRYFEGYVCGDEVVNGKPDKEIFIKACEKVNVKPEEAYVLEDSEMGVLAAYNANISCICVPDMKYPTEKIKAKTYKVVDNLLEALDIIKEDEKRLEGLGYA